MPRVTPLRKVMTKREAHIIRRLKTVAKGCISLPPAAPGRLWLLLAASGQASIEQLENNHRTIIEQCIEQS